MCENEASGQQAVEPVLSAAETADRLEAWAREMLASTPPKTGALHLLDAVHYLRTAAPTAPSTAAGDLARQYLATARAYAGHIAVEQHGPNGEAPCTVADLIDAALATPPAQETNAEIAGWSFEYMTTITEKWQKVVSALEPTMPSSHCRNVRPLYEHPPADVPWQEQAARRCFAEAMRMRQIAYEAPHSEVSDAYRRVADWYVADAHKLRALAASQEAQP